MNRSENSNQVYRYVFAIVLPCLIGLFLTLGLHSNYDLTIDGTGTLLVLLMLGIGPLVFVIDLLITNYLKNPFVHTFFYWLTLGIEFSIMSFGLRVLFQWYITPDNSRLEPLFVCVGVALATVEWGRQQIVALSSDHDEEHDVESIELLSQ